ncbi:MAG: ammonia-forming cytochrome c nitrite reductase subunit c552 [Nitrospirales bacterium]|nr:ammonia-forming cytochrome c nitrite reductase subunit c552 [Nitrospirales bacterium]
MKRGAAVLFLFLLSVLAGCVQPARTDVVGVSIPREEKDPAVWGKKYPNHYDSFLKNGEKSKKYSRYRSDGEDRLGPWPFQFVLFDGWGMSVEYNEPNGHTEMLKDQLAIDPSRRKAGGVCLTCKSPYAPDLKEGLKADYFRQPYEKVHGQIPGKHQQLGISCSDCHEPQSMDLRISRWTLIEALKAVGKDPGKLTRQEMRSLVCAQCHVTYSIPKDEGGASVGLKLPWTYGKWGNISVEAVIAQIKKENLKEWNHKVTGQKLGHVRHPEFELFSAPGSIHWAAGVACADCHMPYERVGREKISSHHWESPVKGNMRACMQCHNQSAEWLKEQVVNIQSRVNHMFTKAGYTVARAALLIEAAKKVPKVDTVLLGRAKEMYQEAYYRNTWIGAENSMGFHNPPEALRVLGDALDFGYKAEVLAREALMKAGATPPEMNTEMIDAVAAKKYAHREGRNEPQKGDGKKAALIGMAGKGR